LKDKKLIDFAPKVLNFRFLRQKYLKEQKPARPARAQKPDNNSAVSSGRIGGQI
jgi:hypothetical protein